MAIIVIVTAEVKDFAEWKAMFDDLEQQRQQMGINFTAYKTAESPNYSYVVGTAPSETIFRDFSLSRKTSYTTIYDVGSP